MNTESQTDQLKKRIAECVTCAPSMTAYQNQKLYDAPELVSLFKDCLKHIEELEDLEATFELRHKADIRAIKQWREGHPERALKMPDHADLVCWLIDELDGYKQTLANSVGEEISVLQLQSQLRERDKHIEELEKERDEYSTALAMICSQPPKYAKPIAEAALKVREADISQFMKEYDEGKHPLSPEDEAALERSKPELMRRLKLQKDAQPPKQ